MTTNATTRGYSLQNAQEFGWNSLTGELLPERRWLLDTMSSDPRCSMRDVVAADSSISEATETRIARRH